MSDSRGVWKKTIQLTSGGFVTVELIGHPLDMAEDDRTFVEQIVDSIKEYETDRTKYAPDTVPAQTTDAAPGGAR